MNTELYRRLAADGNKDAARVLDEMGSMPSQEMGTEESEEQELQELEGLETHLQALIARAEIHTAGDAHGEAAKAHFERGQSHEIAADACRVAGRDAASDEHNRGAKVAYRDCAMSLANHVDKNGADCGYAEGYSLPQIRAIHWRENEGK